MGLEQFENMLKLWKEEVATAGKMTTLKPNHVKRLEKHIDKIYAMHSEIASYEAKVAKWAEEV
jgi:cob(I)alamin adenosyltransferase